MTLEIYKLKHFHVEDYSGIVGNLGLVKKTMEEIY